MSSHDSSRFDAVAATHAQRDAEESARLRQLGALVVHDLNNALFALVGRAQLLRRSIHDPVVGKSADELLNTVRSLERQLSILHKACRVDQARQAQHDHNCNARAALRETLREVLATLPPSIHIDPPFSAENAFFQAIPHDAFFEGDGAQLTTALVQMLSLHRQRAPRSIVLAARVEGTHDEPRLSITITDDAGPAQHALVAPSLLGDSFDLAALAIATANRAIRDFGGRASIARDNEVLGKNVPVHNVPGTNGEQTNVPVHNVPGTNAERTNVPVHNVPGTNGERANVPVHNVPGTNGEPTNVPVHNVPGTDAPERNRSVARGLCSTISFEIRREPTLLSPAESGDADGGSVDASVDIAREFTVLNNTAANCDHPDAYVPVPRRVLVVDDDVTVRAVLAAVLDAVNDDVETMDDPSALDRRTDLHEFDVVILDAGGGGLEALSRLRGRGIDIPVLLASGGEIHLKPDARTRTAMKPIALDVLDGELTLLAAMNKRE